MKIQKKGLLRFCLIALLCLCFLAPLIPEIPVKAAKNEGALANLVICVRFSDSDDAHNIFENAAHWEKVMDMYDTAEDSFKNYMKAISDGKLTVHNLFHKKPCWTAKPSAPRCSWIILPTTIKIMKALWCWMPFMQYKTDAFL